VKLERGAVVTRPGSSVQNKTGGWREFKPVLSQEKCKKCGQCWMICPDMAIFVNEKGEYHINYDFCKGCLMCMKQCPFSAIEKEVEQK
jgi:pyruvate ferredoxin oxidoreductase delta subunit